MYAVLFIPFRNRMCFRKYTEKRTPLHRLILKAAITAAITHTVIALQRMHKPLTVTVYYQLQHLTFADFSGMSPICRTVYTILERNTGIPTVTASSENTSAIAFTDIKRSISFLDFLKAESNGTTISSLCPIVHNGSFIRINSQRYHSDICSLIFPESQATFHFQTDRTHQDVYKSP